MSKRSTPDRIRMFTMRNVMNEDEDDEDRVKQAYIVPNKIFPGIWKQRERFDKYYTANMRLTKFINTCGLKDTELAIKIIETVHQQPLQSRTRSASNSFSRKPSSYRTRNKKISMGHMRNTSDSPSEWTSCSIAEEAGSTPIQHYLLIAIRYNLPEVTQKLIEYKADPLGQGTTEIPYTPIYVAALFGVDLIVSNILASYKPEVCEADENGCTPLHLMVMSGNITEVEAILELGGDLLAEDSFGKLPLYYAYLMRDRAMCQYLWDGMSYLAEAVTSLNLSRCAMNFFPPDNVVGRFQYLETLDVSQNSLYYLPPSLGTLDTLKELNITGNPLKALPKRFSDLSVAEMKRYLASLKESEDNWYRRRVVVVGCNQVGKSSLIRAISTLPTLSSPSMSLKTFKTLRPKSKSVFGTLRAEKESNTDVVPLLTEPLSQSQHSEFLTTSKPTKLAHERPYASVIFWELPGEIKSHTRFFLKGEVIYLVVYNLEELELCDIDQWLECIRQSRSPDSKSPIFLVGTHMDNPLCTNDHISVVIETLQQRYPIGKYKGLYPEHFVSVNCNNSGSTQGLRNRFSQLIQSHKFADKMFPPMSNGSWLVFKELLHNQEQPYMTKEDIHHALHACAIPQEEMMPCITFLQSCDNLIFFDLSAKGLILLILDLSWWVEMVIRATAADNPYLENGIILVENFSRYFSSLTSNFIYHFILVLEEEYLLFRLQDEFLVIPSLLPNVKPAKVSELWPTLAPIGEYECQRIYRYSQSADNLFSSLQQEILHTPNVQNYVIWKEGLALTVNNQQILVTFSIVKRKCQLQICIRYPQEGNGSNGGMMLVICEILEGLIRSNYPFLLNNITRLVPCVHCIMLRVLTGKTFLFTYDECYRAVTQGKPFVFCNHIQSPSRCVRVDKLAPDIGFADIPQISDNQFTTGDLLGRGGFGFVYRGVLDEKHEIAIKELITSVETSEEQQMANFGEFLREAYIMSFLHHPNLVGFFGVCLSSPPRILMEYIPCGDLQHLIAARNKEPLEFELINKIALDIAIGMNHLHSISPPVIHRDLRSPNIFLASLDKNAPIVAKVADFGLSRMKSSQQLQESLSTYQWMAPETLGNGGKKVEYDEKADVYSYAIILWEIVTLQFPFDEFLVVDEYTYTNPVGEVVFNADAVKEAIETKKLRPTIPEEAPDLIKKLIRKCWSHKPTNRPSFKDILQFYLAPGVELSQSVMELSPSVVSKSDHESVEAIVSNSITCQNTFKLNKSDESTPCKLTIVDNSIWIGVHNGLVLIYDIIENSQAKFVSSWQAHVNAVYSIVVCTEEAGPRGINTQTLWMGGTDGMVSVYPATAREQRNMLKKWSLSKKKTSRIRCMLVVKVGKKENVWIGELSTDISIWSPDSFEQIGSVTIDSKGVSEMVQHANGMVWLASLDTIYVFDPETKAQKQKFSAVPQSQILTMLAVGDLMWVAASDGKISVWNSEFAKVRTLTAHTSKIFCLCLDHRGFVWSGSFDTTIIVWDPETWKPVEELATHQDSIRSFGVNNEFVWSLSSDGSLKCWK